MAENQSSTVSSPAIPLTNAELRTCQYRETKGGPICGIEFEVGSGIHRKLNCPKHRNLTGRNYKRKGRSHLPRLTMLPRDCDVCGKALPVPRPNPKRTCDECLSDPARLESMRKEDNKRERDRAAAKCAAKAPPEPVIRRCQHRQEKDGPICGTKFLAMPRIGKNGVNHGVSPEQIYCPEHQKPKAVARRRWLNRDVENYKRLQRNYRHRNVTTVRKKQRIAAKDKRARIAAILLGAEQLKRDAWLPEDWKGWTANEQLIGSLVIRDPGITPRKLGLRLDESRSPVRPPESWSATSWERAFSNPGPGATWLSRLRTRLRKAGLAGLLQ